MKRIGTISALIVIPFGIFAAALIVGPVSTAARPAAPAAPMSHECAGVPKCISVPGPWVIVSGSSETAYVLSCPKNRGFAAGIDALATSRDVHVTFDGLMASPVASGHTTGSSILFRGVSGSHELGAFRPFIGCIPVSSTSPQTVSFQPAGGHRTAFTSNRVILAAPRVSSGGVTPAGPPLSVAAQTVALHPGSSSAATLGCTSDQRLVDSWEATAFDTSSPPDLTLASGVHVRLEVHGDKASISAATSNAVPSSAHPQAEIGIRCAER